jgi:phosphatidylglycerol:prolipoprotein diacylglycerol transferase
VRRTLFYLPHEIAGLPLFGWGWMLILWLAVSGVTLFWTARRGGWTRELRGQLPMILLVAAVIVFVIPRVEEPLRDTPLTIPPVAADSGLPIRGYGVMLLLAVAGGVALASYRARRAGLSTDLIMALAFFLVVGGIVGARLFFVMQYWELLRGESWRETLANLFSIDKGGLVVYGSLLGAMVAFLAFCRKYGLPPLPLADLIAPSLALGLALGRVGCLLNGCCFGGTCDHAWAVTFPADSPPYLDQKGWGNFHGLQLAAGKGGESGQAVVADVDPQGPFAGTTLGAGQAIVAINGQTVPELSMARSVLEQAGPELTLTLGDGRTVAAEIARLPARSRPVHPTQIYSSLNAALLCLLTITFYPFRRRHGQVIALLLTVYAVTRFLLEVIRTDEPGFLTGLTISQNVSILVTASMVVIWIYIQRQPIIPPAQNRPAPTSVPEAAT